MGQARATLGTKHPRIVQLQSEIDATRKSLQSAVQARYSSAALAITRARELETKYENAVAAERARLLAYRDVRDDGAKLQLELRLAEEAYASALAGQGGVSGGREAGKWIGANLVPLEVGADVLLLGVGRLALGETRLELLFGLVDARLDARHELVAGHGEARLLLGSGVVVVRGVGHDGHGEGDGAGCEEHAG